MQSKFNEHLRIEKKKPGLNIFKYKETSNLAKMI